CRTAIGVADDISLSVALCPALGSALGCPWALAQTTWPLPDGRGHVVCSSITQLVLPSSVGLRLDDSESAHVGDTPRGKRAVKHMHRLGGPQQERAYGDAVAQYFQGGEGNVGSVQVGHDQQIGFIFEK